MADELDVDSYICPFWEASIRRLDKVSRAE